MYSLISNWGLVKLSYIDLLVLIRVYGVVDQLHISIIHRI